MPSAPISSVKLVRLRVPATSVGAAHERAATVFAAQRAVNPRDCAAHGDGDAADAEQPAELVFGRDLTARRPIAIGDDARGSPVRPGAKAVPAGGGPAVRSALRSSSCPPLRSCLASGQCRADETRPRTELARCRRGCREDAAGKWRRSAAMSGGAKHVERFGQPAGDEHDLRIEKRDGAGQGRSPSRAAIVPTAVGLPGRRRGRQRSPPHRRRRRAGPARSRRARDRRRGAPANPAAHRRRRSRRRRPSRRSRRRHESHERCGHRRARPSRSPCRWRRGSRSGIPRAAPSSLPRARRNGRRCRLPCA